jgi:Mg-chelatase subunit ChlD
VIRLACLLTTIVALSFPLVAADEDLVFRSDVSLVRVDAQVVDRANRAITGLQKEDFVLLEDGRKQDIRNFESEDMPIDVLLLLDVSGSMQPHIQRLSEAAHRAMQVLGRGDRVGVMVFDRQSRLRLPFRNNLDMVERELELVLSQETFDGGTDITRGMLDAAKYIGREGRKEARHAIVILTDDQTERDREDATVLRALSQADAVMSALIAPDALAGRYGGGGGGMGGGGWPRRGGGGMGGGWPGGGGGGLGGPLGGIILGPRGPYGGRGGGGPIMTRSHTRSAGTEEIAKQSGGDSLRVDDASALETTLMRLRQRYALHFNLPQGVQPGQERNIEVQLSDEARRRYPGSEVRYRRSYVGQDGARPEPVMVSKTPSNPSRQPVAATSDDRPTQRRRRPAVNDDGSVIDNPQSSPNGGGWRRADEPAPAATAPVPAVAAPAPVQPAPEEPKPQQGGWRRVKPGEQP